MLLQYNFHWVAMNLYTYSLIYFISNDCEYMPYNIRKLNFHSIDTVILQKKSNIAENVYRLFFTAENYIIYCIFMLFYRFKFN